MLPINKIKNVEGRLLTLIDASLPEGKQSKAVKDMVRSIMGNLYSYADYSSSAFTVSEGERGEVVIGTGGSIPKANIDFVNDSKVK